MEIFEEENNSRYRIWNISLKSKKIVLIIVIIILSFIGLISIICVEEYQTREDNIENHRLYDDRTFNILIWTSNNSYPFVYFKKGEEVFKKNKCEFTNCYITNNRAHLGNITDFDAVLFNAPEVTSSYSFNRGMPRERSPNQTYIFATIQSSHYYPVCHALLDGYFNWTWTYKTSSEILWNCVVIRDLDGKIVGPKQDILWIEDMDDVDEETMNILKGKTKAVAWINNDCRAKSDRNDYAIKLARNLEKYNLKIDTYGECGEYKCQNNEECFDHIKTDYFFYLAFENSVAEDYVTDRFLKGVKNYAIPIVLGGANYDRFAPPYSYIDTNVTNPEKMAEIIDHLMHDSEEYASYFKWRNYYKYQMDNESPDTRAACKLCEALNKNYLKMDGSTTKYKDFRKWWNTNSNDC